MFPATTNLGYPRCYIGKTGTPSRSISGDMQVVNTVSGVRLWYQLEIRLLMGSARKQIQMQDKEGQYKWEVKESEPELAFHQK